MKKVLKVLGVLLLLLILGAAGGFFYIKKSYPKAGPVVEVKINSDSATIARGAYLANHVANCVACHSPRRLDVFGIPPIEDSIGKGGLRFDHNLGFPGVFYTKNITPAGIGDWTDAEIYHALTTGVRKNGEPLFPFMPYTHYRTADPEDIKAIIAYIRTLKPIENEVPEAQPDFPLSLIMRTIPSPADPQERPSMSDTLKYGAYMFNLAGCNDCHTPMDKGQPIAGMEMAGGSEYKLIGCGTLRSANLTPDMETGIGSWNQQTFMAMFRYYSKPENREVNWKDRGYQTIMPWLEYSGMTDEDLTAIYKYLRTMKPVKNKVVKFTPEGQDGTAMN